ncbi:adenosine deaminase [Candidatus Syntrophosphaera thermopropionivorans]|jgi:adenosine deaminase|uniref:Adenosine deaminase n=1 Tax=Candidatus Syntrophosphaera thermopropionivorans TaxID=2593015 RepID=A0AC61QKY0_9BACT|nr:adenosine deaminase [Candidatus Syntrophosphaera thermopropionivorans]TDF74631.1 adenosine deaminase [Candidatus Syntrophosphaera thermopropionivorans]HOZ91688.1 adenosine deaminase [Candidatus Syntrophosphaera thermopropionivorans]
MNIKLTREFVQKLPKTDLHVHLDGSVRINTIIDLAKKFNIQLPTMDPGELRKLIVCDEHTRSLEEYLRGFDIVNLVLQTKEGLYRAAYELAEDAANENVRYMEVRFSPILHTKKGLKMTEITQSVIDGLRQAEREFPIETGVIICGLRNMDPTTSIKLAELAVAFKNRGVVGFDLAGSEFNYPAKEHKEAFELSLKNNLNITIHAGEAYGPDSIHQAVHYCGAHRIGHGTRLVEDGDLLNYVNDHRIPLEICIKSNFHTKAVPNIQSHPIDFYIDYGLRVTINTDNRTISDTTVTDEYMLAINELHLDYPTIKNVILNGFKSAFLPYKERVRLINETLRELEELEKSELKTTIKMKENL